MFRVRALAALAAATVVSLSLVSSGWAQSPKPTASPAMGGGKMMGGKTARKTPMRDPKTGRFIKGSGGKMAGGKMTGGKMTGGKMSGKKGGMMTGGKMTGGKMSVGKTARKTPKRDPKTGRFIKG